MRPTRFSLLVLAAVVLPGMTVGAPTQGDRRTRESPELLLNTGGRTATCDVLTFAPGGRLLAAGDDKVIHTWIVEDTRLKATDNLYWSAWREQRGSIYALALDPTARRVAIAGVGLRTGMVQVIDRATNEVKASLVGTQDKENPEKKINFAIRALAFSPSGKEVAIGTETGDIWLWEIDKPDAHWLGESRPDDWDKNEKFDRVRLLAYRHGKENQLLSVAEDGRVLEWNPNKPGHSEDLVKIKKGHSVYRAALSSDGNWLAEATSGPTVVLRSLDGKADKKISLGESRYPRSLAFDKAGKRLAVGIGRVSPEADGFFVEGDDRVTVYDVTLEQPKELLTLLDPDKNKSFPFHYHAEALAFDPEHPSHLAMAGGSDHNVTLWDLNRPEKPLADEHGMGTCLWSVGLSPDGHLLGFQDHHESKPAGPNKRGTGEWRVFDLDARQWDPKVKAFEPVQQHSTLNGWKVEPSEDAYVWYAVNGDRRYQLELDTSRDQHPNCYTFLDKPTRLVVGHYYGLSVFDLTDPKYRTRKGGKEMVRPSRLFTGHQGDVTAVAVSANQQWLVSASRDQTIAAWKLDAWPHQEQLGASFKIRDGKLVVEEVALGSPAWEAGLVKEDEVVLLFVGGPKNKVYDRDGSPEYGKRGGTPEAAWEDLKAPVSGKELYFGLRRAGRDDMVQTLTTVRQRPLWRFFPASNHEWALWMWRAPYYDCSTNGDFYLGWLLNHVDGPDKEPKFYKAEQFRELFRKPPAIATLLQTHQVEEALRQAMPGRRGLVPPSFHEFEPPAVRIVGLPKEVKDKPIEVTLIAEPSDNNPDHQPQRVDLWVNDHRIRSWGPLNKAFHTKFTLPPEVFRAGPNQVTLQCYNHVTGRGIGRAEVIETIECQRPKKAGKLYALLVGINDYSQTVKSNGEKGLFGNLECAQRDAESLAQACQVQKSLYKDIELSVLPAPGKPATRKAILEELKTLAEKAGPDDRVVLFLSGHGDEAGDEDDKTFVFCCPSYDKKHFAETGLTSRDLYEALAAIRCRKLVLLDACHAGALATNPVRDLTPGGQGPIILSACDQSELSFEEPKLLKHGLFTYALLDAMSKDFDKADQDPKDGQLSVPELFAYVQTRVPELTQEMKLKPQTPACFPAELENYPLVKKVEKPEEK